MARRIRVRGVPRREPDVQLYVLALVELARQLQAEEAATSAGGNDVAEPAEQTAEVGND